MLRLVQQERGGDPPTRDSFKFTKTHSRVTFIDKVEAVEKELKGSESGIFETEGKSSFFTLDESMISLTHD